MAEFQVDIPTVDGTADCYLFQPDSGGPFPAVVYLPDIHGVRAVFMDMARKVAPDSPHLKADKIEALHWKRLFSLLERNSPHA